MDAAACKWRNHSNLQCFLARITPSVTARSLPKACIGDFDCPWQSDSKDIVEYFTLQNLWDSYYEWSAYGAGAPILLSNGETVVQYYVPYLSAIQIFTTKIHAILRNVSEESETDSWSDDSESEKLSRSWDAVSDDSVSDQDGSRPMKDRHGHLYFQYIETSSPYARTPLKDKINDLARHYPGLTSFRSTDLSPASWMSVAWYPIYHIPTRRNVKDLSACFLTYHTISSLFQESIPGAMEKDECCTFAGKHGRKLDEAGSCFSLSPFGLATYKMQGDVWINPEASDHERIITLYNAADSWLKQLRVQHHDFNYFNTHCCHNIALL